MVRKEHHSEWTVLKTRLFGPPRPSLKPAELWIDFALAEFRAKGGSRYPARASDGSGARFGAAFFLALVGIGRGIVLDSPRRIA
jgi:hypothetical protein